VSRGWPGSSGTPQNQYLGLCGIGQGENGVGYDGAVKGLDCARIKGQRQIAALSGIVPTDHVGGASKTSMAGNAQDNIRSPPFDAQCLEIRRNILSINGCHIRSGKASQLQG
jgi:hypothetical protein